VKTDCFRLVPACAIVLLLAAATPAQPVWRQAFPPTPYGGLTTRFVLDQARGVLVLFDGDTAATWEWNGSAWNRRTPPVSPPARSSFAMAYDVARARTVLFGGTNAPLVALADTWEWDGTTWSQATPAVSPPARKSHAMAWDPVNGQVLLYGGLLPPTGWLGDTWLWNGVLWTQAGTPNGPNAPAGIPFRWDHAMATDPARQRVVVFGGWDPSGALLPETLEWNGAAWTRSLPATSPLPRAGAALAYDAQRARMILFGGTRNPADLGLSDTWEWDGTSWTQSASPGPAGRFDHALAYLPSMNRTVLFGGVWGFYRAHTDLWTWDGTTWLQVQPQARPTATSGHGLAYDGIRRRTVLYNGGETWEWDGTSWTLHFPATSPGYLKRAPMAWRGRTVLVGTRFGDTWEWDGSNWTQAAPPNPAFAQVGLAIAFDSRRGRTVLFGAGVGTTDTWEWDGVIWTRVAVTGPSSRTYHAMAYDSARGRTVLYGGFGTLGVLSDTWEWDGVAWTQIVSAQTPGPRYQHAMAGRSPGGRVILFGGNAAFHGPEFADIWEWNGVNWTQPVAPVAPGPRSVHAMAFDSVRNRVVLFGGQVSVGSGGPRYLSDTWELFERFGSAGPGHPGGGLAIAWTPPWIGTTFCVGFSDPPPVGAGFNLLLLASGPAVQPPAVLNPPGVCTVANLYLAPQVVLSSTGDPALFCIAIPSNPALVGQLVTIQGAALEVGVCFRLTDALTGEIQ